MSDEIRKDDDMDNETNTPDAVEPDDTAPEVDETPASEAQPTTGGDDPSPWGMNRRDVVKALATVPFVGALGYEAFRKRGIQDDKRDAIADERIQLTVYGESREPSRMSSTTSTACSRTPASSGSISRAFRADGVVSTRHSRSGARLLFNSSSISGSSSTISTFTMSSIIIW